MDIEHQESGEKSDQDAPGAGIGRATDVLLDTNRDDFEELPEHICDGMTVHFAGHYRDVVPVVFEK